MATLRISAVLLAFATIGAGDTTEPVVEETGCTITTTVCKNFPEYHRSQFRDAIAEEHMDARNNEAACLKRAEDFHHWCGNGRGSVAMVAATFNKKQWTQVYHPGACEEGWSQWDAFCYKHYWEKKTWFEAEHLCRQRDSHLASVHSQAENRFVFTLTSGLSAWIGYTDMDQDTHYQWSDNTQDDFTNFAKNCTGREHEPDCRPEERQQQWYDWNGGDAGTFVCKRNALLPVGILKNVSAALMISKPWAELLPVLTATRTEVNTSTLGKQGAAPELKVDDIVSPEPSASVPVPGSAEPRLSMPKGSFF